MRFVGAAGRCEFQTGFEVQLFNLQFMEDLTVSSLACPCTCARVRLSAHVFVLSLGHFFFRFCTHLSYFLVSQAPTFFLSPPVSLYISLPFCLSFDTSMYVSNVLLCSLHIYIYVDICTHTCRYVKRETKKAYTIK